MTAFARGFQAYYNNDYRSPVMHGIDPASPDASEFLRGWDKAADNVHERLLAA